MLVLHRKKNEFIHIRVGDLLIRVGIAEIQGKQVSIGIEAPKDKVVILREELDNAPSRTSNSNGSSEGPAKSSASAVNNRTRYCE